jgi:hypothetical protein
MNNQSSPAQLLFPTVPANYCPEGRWSDIFNSFIQLYLNNGTVNIPGLGEVTPAEIATINQELQDLQNQYDALTSNVRSGKITSITTGAAFVTPIVFSTPMPTANYQIYVEFVSTTTGGTGDTPQYWSIVTGTKTATGFSLRTQMSPASAISAINWQVFSLTTT